MALICRKLHRKGS